MTHRELEPKDEQMIGRLISSSGQRATPRPEARERIYAAVHTEWKRNIVRDETPSVERGRPAAGWLAALFSPGFAAAAATAVAVALGVAVFLQVPTDDEPVALASIDKLVGTVELVDAQGAVSGSGAETGMTVLSGQRLITGTDGGAAVELATGESVRLNTGTELSFLSAGNVELRSGAVYLDSEGATDAGVVVTTAYGDVRHIGTQYEVSLQPSDLRVRVREGAVAIVADTVEHVGEAGEQILVPRAGDVQRSAIAATDPAWAWTESLAALPEASEYELTELLDWVARQTGREVRFENQELLSEAEGLVVHGIVAGLTPQETYDVIRNTTGLDYRMTGENLIVY